MVLFNGFGYLRLMFVEHQSTSGTKILPLLSLRKSINALFLTYCFYGTNRIITTIVIVEFPFAGTYSSGLVAGLAGGRQALHYIRNIPNAITLKH